MNIEGLSEFCSYCRKRLQEGEQYYHMECHEESKQYKNQFIDFIEFQGQMYWKKDWEIDCELRKWAKKFEDITIYTDYDSFKDEKSGFDILFVHDLRIINKSNKNIPDILFFKRIECIYLFFKRKTNKNSMVYSIPKSILSLKTLRGLWINNIQERSISNNNKIINSIHGSFKNLTNLERLFLLYEGAEFPIGLENLAKLKELIIGDINTSHKINFPKEIFTLKHLKILSCGFIEPKERKRIVKRLKKMKSFEAISFRDYDYNLPKRIYGANFKLKITNYKSTDSII